MVNRSFVSNMFRGEVITKEVFPYPFALNEEQREEIGAFVDPVTAFFTVCRSYLPYSVFEFKASFLTIFGSDFKIFYIKHY